MNNHLTLSFYSVPNAATMTLTKKELKETLLSTDGWIFSCGEAWDIKSKSLGAGVYKVYLEKRKF